MDERAEQIPVPGPEDPWWPVINEFALTFNAYDRLRSSDEVARVANEAQDRFVESGALPGTIEELRTCLFFEQRRWRHFDADPLEDAEARPYILALVAALREATGGFVDGPGDPYP